MGAKRPIQKKGGGRKNGLWRKAYLATLSELGNISAAAKAAGVDRKSVYRAMDADEAFKADCEDAMERASDLLELEARRRAYKGVEEPVFYKGEEVSAVTKYSDTLLMFLLNGHRPWRFRHRHEISGPNGGPVGVIVAPAPIEPDAWAKLAQQNAETIQAAVSGSAPTEEE